MHVCSVCYVAGCEQNKQIIAASVRLMSRWTVVIVLAANSLFAALTLR